MLRKLSAFSKRLAMEPPFRLASRVLVKYCSTSIRTKGLWDTVDRPHYLAGVLRATDQAKRQQVSEICVAEFGVANGHGLLALQEYAESVEKETGIRIWVYGFDLGDGLPTLCDGFRDHPDLFRPGDYSMDDQEDLSEKLIERTKLILGNVANTVPDFVRNVQSAPLGFAAMDIDLYTSTRDALKILSMPERKILRRVALYFDEVKLDFFHRFAGEFLAIDEFNEENKDVKIDKWHGIKTLRPFPEHSWLNCMYVAHDLEAISNVQFADRPDHVIGLTY